MTYGYCVYHERECDYKGSCIDCPYNTVEDTEWFKQDEELENIVKYSMEKYAEDYLDALNMAIKALEQES